MENILNCINRASADKGNISRHIIESSMAAFYVGYCIPFSKFVVLILALSSCANPEGDRGPDPHPPEKSQKHRFF